MTVSGFRSFEFNGSTLERLAAVPVRDAPARRAFDFVGMTLPPLGWNPAGIIYHDRFQVKGEIASCQGKVEMSPRWQSRNVPFSPSCRGVRDILRVPVKRRRAMLASNPIEE